MNLLELAGEHQRQDGHQLDQNVQSRSRGVLQGISDSITDNSGLVDITSLGNLVALLVNHGSTLDVFLGVVPCSTSVGSRNGHLDSTHNSSRQETSQNVGTEGETQNQGSQNDLNKHNCTNAPGAIISIKEALVEILMQAL